jgi:hypothetical protein
LKARVSGKAGGCLANYLQSMSNSILLDSEGPRSQAISAAQALAQLGAFPVHQGALLEVRTKKKMMAITL